MTNLLVSPMTAKSRSKIGASTRYFQPSRRSRHPPLPVGAEAGGGARSEVPHDHVAVGLADAELVEGHHPVDLVVGRVAVHATTYDQRPARMVGVALGHEQLVAEAGVREHRACR